MSPRPYFEANSRKQCYKVNVFDTVEARHKREKIIMEIRKSNREEGLSKKRREGFSVFPISQPSSGYDQTSYLERKLRNLPMIASKLASHDIQTKVTAAVEIRQMLSNENINPPIDAVIKSGVVPLLVDILKMDRMPLIQFEAAWALTNIVSGTSKHTKVVIDNGAVPLFVKLLTSRHDNVREQAVWALGNIAGDSQAYRDLALRHGAVEQVLAQFTGTAGISMIRNATWTVSNFFRVKPQPELHQVKNALPALRWLINMQDDEVLVDACWALSYISDGPTENVQAVIDAGICPKLVELLSHPSPFIITPALRTVGNIVNGNDVQTQAVIDNQALPHILHLLRAEQTNKSIKTEACWTISNITAGTKDQIQAVINAKIFPPLLSLLANAEFCTKGEAAWVIANATSGGSDEQIKYLALQGCIQPLCDLLNCPDPNIITVCLKGLENILRAGEAEKKAGLTDVNAYVRLIEDAYGLDKIQSLQYHENTEIYEKSVKILENYFAEKDDDQMLKSSDIVENYLLKKDDDEC